jgi:hypothetical protein
MDLNTFKEYLKLHILSLEQDEEHLNKYFNSVTEFDSDEYRTAEIEDISNGGQLIACYHLLGVLEETQ